MTKMTVADLGVQHINQPIEVVNEKGDRYAGILVGFDDVSGISYVEMFFSYLEDRDSVRAGRECEIKVHVPFASGGVIHNNISQGGIMPCTSEPFAPGMK